MQVLLSDWLVSLETIDWYHSRSIGERLSSLQVDERIKRNGTNAVVHAVEVVEKLSSTIGTFGKVSRLYALSAGIVFLLPFGAT